MYRGHGTGLTGRDFHGSFVRFNHHQQIRFADHITGRRRHFDDHHICGFTDVRYPYLDQ